MQIIGYIFALIVASIILLAQKISIQWKFDRKLMAEIFRKSYPYALLGFLMTAYYRTDGVMLERMLGDNGAYEAGIYATAFRLLDAMSILGFLFAGLLMPMFSRMIENKETIKPLFDLGYTLMLVFSVSAGVAIIFYRLEIMELLYSTGDAYSADILGWLMVSFISISITYIYGSLITANGSIKLLNQISLIGFALNITLNLILIPHYHALGSAIATVISQILILSAHILYAGKIFNFKNGIRYWVPSILFVAIIVVINLGLRQIDINWYFSFFGGMLISVLAAFGVGLIKFTEFTQALEPILTSLRKRA